jgi:hypothetical protein
MATTATINQSMERHGGMESEARSAMVNGNVNGNGNGNGNEDAELPLFECRLVDFMTLTRVRSPDLICRRKESYMVEYRPTYRQLIEFLIDVDPFVYGETDHVTIRYDTIRLLDLI